MTQLLYNDCYWYTLFHSNIITQRVKKSYKNIENPKSITMKHELKNELKNEDHFLSEKKPMILVDGGRAENLGEPTLNWGPDLPILVAIEKTDLPKSVSFMAPPAPTCQILVEHEPKATEDVKKVKTEMFDENITMDWIDSWQPNITKKHKMKNIHKRIR